MSSYIPEVLRRLVTERANACCEYCLLGADDNFFPHEVDHIIAEKHRGKTEEANLCLSCFDCNRYKGSDIGSVDIVTDRLTSLFHPRRQRWTDHFRLNGALIEPLTPEGRVTVYLLRLNDDERVAKRTELIELGRYPCRSDG